ncbi:MAG: ribonuclease Y [Candidatus Andersenbacteria bacterium]
MPVISTVIAAVVAAGVGVAAGYQIRRNAGARKEESVDKKIESKIAAAKTKVVTLREQAEKEAREIREKAEKDLDERRSQILELEKRVAEREEKIDSKLEQLEQRDKALVDQQEQLSKREEELKALKGEEEKKLADISGLTSEQAQQRVMELAEERTKEDIVRRVRKMEKEGDRELEEKARDILSNVIQRYASSHVAEHSTSYVDVPDESMIGRIIGKEGRNIQHIERVTGCEIVIDSEAGHSIMISGFSPMRRQVAKKAIEQLMKDGRIHPGRIEEVVEEAKKKINDDIREAGETVVYDLGIVDFPPQLIHLVGRMKYRTSYGQNILRHSWEAARIAMMLAQELGADVNIAKKATLLHDIGKAIDHEVEGNHVEIGEKIMRKFGVSEEIVRAAAAHHEDYPFDTREAIIVQVSDAISAARPGARREDVEGYVKRMEDLEQIATSYEGVNKAYAIYAGREIRVFVEPKEIDDLGAIKLAQSIAKQIEQEMTYPGDVKVNVIRETRSDALAR